MLTALVVARVAEAVLDGQADARLVQQWASFVRRGYLEILGPPIRPIDITYEGEFEEAMVEVISMLDQLGDDVDGTPNVPVLRGLILQLRSRSIGDS